MNCLQLDGLAHEQYLHKPDIEPLAYKQAITGRSCIPSAVLTVSREQQSELASC